MVQEATCTATDEIQSMTGNPGSLERLFSIWGEALILFLFIYTQISGNVAEKIPLPAFPAPLCEKFIESYTSPVDLYSYLFALYSDWYKRSLWPLDLVVLCLIWLAVRKDLQDSKYGDSVKHRNPTVCIQGWGYSWLKLHCSNCSCRK